jgi:hypothetical protein
MPLLARYRRDLDLPGLLRALQYAGEVDILVEALRKAEELFG